MNLLRSDPIDDRIAGSTTCGFLLSYDSDLNSYPSSSPSPPILYVCTIFGHEMSTVCKNCRKTLYNLSFFVSIWLNVRLHYLWLSNLTHLLIYFFCLLVRSRLWSDVRILWNYIRVTACKDLFDKYSKTIEIRW